MSTFNCRLVGINQSIPERLSQVPLLCLIQRLSALVLVLVQVLILLLTLLLVMVRFFRCLIMLVISQYVVVAVVLSRPLLLDARQYCVVLVSGAMPKAMTRGRFGDANTRR